MDALSELVDTLVAGAAAVRSERCPPEVRGAYDALADALRTQFPDAGGTLRLIERKPASADFRQGLIDDLTAAGAENADVLHLLVRKCSRALAQQPQVNADNSIVNVNTTVHGDQALGDIIKFHFGEGRPDLDEQHRLLLEYCRSWFSESWADVPLDVFTGGADQPVSLLDVYVPLPADCAIRIQWHATDDGALIDDWEVVDESEVGKQEREQRNEGDDRHKRRREWPSLGVAEREISVLIRRYQEFLDTQFKQARASSEPIETRVEDQSMLLDAEDAACIQRRFVLLGGPGSGKSSFVRHLTLCLAGAQRRELGDNTVPEHATLERDDLYGWAHGPLLPVYIELRDLANVFPALPVDPAVQPKPPGLAAFWQYVAHSLLNPNDHLRSPKFGALLHDALLDGRAVLIFDGLDEVAHTADPRRRAQILALIKALEKQYGGARFIITSRPYAYKQGEWALPGFGHAELRALDPDRLERLAQSLFTHLSPNEADADAAAFRDALGGIDERLRRNPLFFTLLAAIWLRSAPTGKHSLPQTEGALYRKSIELMLEKWTKSKGQMSVIEQLKLSPEQLRIVLQVVALQAQDWSPVADDSTEFDDDKLVLAIHRTHGNAPTDDVMAYLEQRAGILVSTHPHKFRFAHRSFQEHLAARELCERSNTRKPTIDDADRFPAGLLRRTESDPQLWTVVLQHASDQLIAEDSDALWTLIAGLIEPYEDGRRHPAAISMTVHAFALAKRHALLTIERKRHTRQASILSAMQSVALQLVPDEGAAAPQRAEAGIALAALGDPRREVLDVDAMRFVPIPAGTFWMGSPKDDADGFASERPRHQQKVKRDYRMGKYPVTIAQWRQFREAADGYGQDEWWTGLAMPDDHRSSTREPRFDHANHPAQNVSWYEAVAFSRWLTARWRASGKIKANEEVRLPSETEWERAARGPAGQEETYRSRPWSNELTSEHANYDQTGIRQTTAVGCFPKGRVSWGEEALEEMLGNVWEWTTTKWTNGYVDYAPNDDLGGTVDRVLRGGSWNGNHRDARCAFRHWLVAPNARFNILGFRMVVSPT